MERTSGWIFARTLVLGLKKTSLGASSKKCLNYFMRTYQFQALNSDGQKVRGTIPANSHEQALQSLKLKNLQIIFPVQSRA